MWKIKSLFITKPTYGEANIKNAQVDDKITDMLAKKNRNEALWSAAERQLALQEACYAYSTRDEYLVKELKRKIHDCRQIKGMLDNAEYHAWQVEIKMVRQKEHEKMENF